jgi:iron(III) transport system substrate-binding protein
MAARWEVLRRFGVSLAAVVSLVLAGCGAPLDAGSAPGDGSAPAGGARAGTRHPWDGLTGTARTQVLLAAAKREGTLSVYSGFNDEQSMARAFTQKYGIPVTVYSANSETVLQRVTQEHSAARPGNDVLVNPAADMQAAQAQGLLDNYVSAYRDAVSARGKGERWTGVRRLAFVAGWNTDLVHPGDLPADYSGFADPAWRGRLSMEYGDVDWYAALRAYYLGKGRPPADVTRMFQAIASNAKTVKGHTVQGDLLAAGQFAVAMSVYTQTVQRLVDSGAPVSFGAGGGAEHVVAPVVVRYDAGGVMAGTDNPAGAALYLDFELGADGAALDRQLGALPPVPGPGDPLAHLPTTELDVPGFVSDRARLAKEYDQIVRSGAAAN